jgi:hypothetical protein
MVENQAKILRETVREKRYAYHLDHVEPCYCFVKQDRRDSSAADDAKKF